MLCDGLSEHLPARLKSPLLGGRTLRLGAALGDHKRHLCDVNNRHLRREKLQQQPT